MGNYKIQDRISIFLLHANCDLSYDYVIYMLTGINLHQISLSDLGLIHTRENTEIL